MYEDREADAGGQKFGRPKNRTLTGGNKTEERQTAHDTVAVKLRAQEWGFLSRCHHQTTPGPPESMNKRFYTKDRAFQCHLPLMWTGGVFQSIPGAFIMRLPCSNKDPLGVSTSKHKLTATISIARSTPGTISSLFCIISSLSWNLCLSPDLLCKTAVGTYLAMTSTIARPNATLISWLQNSVSCKAPDCTADTVPVGAML